MRAYLILTVRPVDAARPAAHPVRVLLLLLPMHTLGGPVMVLVLVLVLLLLHLRLDLRLDLRLHLSAHEELQRRDLRRKGRVLQLLREVALRHVASRAGLDLAEQLLDHGREREPAQRALRRERGLARRRRARTLTLLLRLMLMLMLVLVRLSIRRAVLRVRRHRAGLMRRRGVRKGGR